MKIKNICLVALILTCCTTNLVSSVSVSLNPIASEYFTSCGYASDKVWCIPKAAYIQKFTNDPEKWLQSLNSLVISPAACSSCEKTQGCTKLNEETLIGQYQNPSGTGYCMVWTASASDYNNILS